MPTTSGDKVEIVSADLGDGAAEKPRPRPAKASKGAKLAASKAKVTKKARSAAAASSADEASPRKKKQKTAEKTTKAESARARRLTAPEGVLRQIDTTPDDAAGAILLAAMDLMGAHGPAKVSLREIAAEAGVNYGLIHRHFGTKASLLLSIFQAFTDYGGDIIRGSETIHEAVAGTFNADAGRYADLLASAVIDGIDPHRLYVDSSGMGVFADHIAAEWAEPSADFERRDEFDPRVVGSFVMLMVVVWDFYAPYMRVVNGFEDRSLVDVRGEILDLMQYLVAVSGPEA